MKLVKDESGCYIEDSRGQRVYMAAETYEELVAWGQRRVSFFNAPPGPSLPLPLFCECGDESEWVPGAGCGCQSCGHCKKCGKRAWPKQSVAEYADMTSHHKMPVTVKLERTELLELGRSFKEASEAGERVYPCGLCKGTGKAQVDGLACSACGGSGCSGL